MDNHAEFELPIAIEDRFLIFSIKHAPNALPTGRFSQAFGELLREVSNRKGGYKPVFDLRGLPAFYSDIEEFIHDTHYGIGREDSPLVLVSPSNKLAFEDFFGRDLGFETLSTEGISYHAIKFNFPEELPFQVRNNIGKVSSSLENLIDQEQRSSLLSAMALSASGDGISCAPYHCNAVHKIGLPSDAVIAGRPAVLAKKTNSTLSVEIEQFEHLLNDSSTKERHIQSFLEAYPNFLSGLNYSNVYSQLVLQRDDSSSLRPDFILEPFEDGWCDILDIKLPSQSIVVGRRDRVTLAAGIHEVAAQLREYAAYFEEERHRRFVKEKYGLNVYRPRLIAIVGRDLRDSGDASVRRAMTQYESLRIMTFQELIEHARSRILI